MFNFLKMSYIIFTRHYVTPNEDIRPLILKKECLSVILNCLMINAYFIISEKILSLLLCANEVPF